MPTFSQMTHLASDMMAGKPTSLRSPKWATLRKKLIAANPVCQVCGNTDLDSLVAHHRKPFHLFPELELEPSNIAIVCENGPGHMNCHLIIGHTGSFQQWNPNFDADAEYVGAMLKRTGAEYGNIDNPG